MRKQWIEALPPDVYLKFTKKPKPGWTFNEEEQKWYNRFGAEHQDTTNTTQEVPATPKKLQKDQGMFQALPSQI